MLFNYCRYLFQYFLLIQNEKFKNDYVYLSWLARCCTYQNVHVRSYIYPNVLISFIAVFSSV